MSVTLPYPTLGPGPVDSAKLLANFNALANAIGSIDNSYIDSGAAIDVNKLSAQYEYMVIKFKLSDGTSLNNIDVCPFYNDGLGDWTYVATQWATQDTGAPTAVFKIQWGSYSGGGSSATPAVTVTSTIDTVALAGIEIQSQASDASPAVTSLASGTNKMLWAQISTVDAAAGQPIYIGCLLKRKIAT